MRKRGIIGVPPKMNLQFFAEPAPDPTPEPDPTPDPTPTPDPEPPKFDDLLENKDYQAEYERRVQKAIETEREKWKALMDDKLSEAEKLAKMNKEEKAEYLRQKRDRELNDREAAITRRELMAEAKNTLAEKKLPVGLAEVLNYTDAESCNKSIEVVEKAFQDAVQAATEEKLKGGAPIKKAPQGGSFTKEQVAAMTPEEINENWEAISKSMAAWNK